MRSDYAKSLLLLAHLFGSALSFIALISTVNPALEMRHPGIVIGLYATFVVASGLGRMSVEVPRGPLAAAELAYRLEYEGRAAERIRLGEPPEIAKNSAKNEMAREASEALSL